MAAMDTHKSLGREMLLARPGGHQQIATLCGLSKQQIYSFRVGCTKPEKVARKKMEKALGISSNSWDAPPASIPARGNRHIGPTTLAPKPPEDPLACGEDDEEESHPLPAAQPLQRTGSSHEQRGQTLDDVRALISRLRSAMDSGKVKNPTNLANSLRQAYKLEAELTEALTHTETDWAESKSFREFVDVIFDALQPFPQALESVQSILSSYASS